MSNIILAGHIGMAKKDQKNGYGFDVIRGQLQVIQEGYDADLWEPVSINGNSEVFKIKPTDEPLTFERIRKECVTGETLLICADDPKRLYLGFNRNGDLITDLIDGRYCDSFREEEIKDWRIGERWVRND